ncbi:hypothetical protein [Candidatus Phyllobacterium onerii]|uniref:hypothetical protein n=1 Tax=Candidatus Phyllobacterium onerii TaxID=3020828 RepID=UPI00232D7433|nr:hypothetical protein [Phyllobacterium sp. IY22]
MVIGIGEAYGALKDAFEIAKGIKDINDKVAQNNAVMALQGKILEAQAATLSSADRERALEEKMTDLKRRLSLYEDWDEMAANYVLMDYGGNTYAYEFVVDPSETSNAPHRACPNCFGQRKNPFCNSRYATLISAIITSVTHVGTHLYSA